MAWLSLGMTMILIIDLTVVVTMLRICRLTPMNTLQRNPVTAVPHPPGTKGLDPAKTRLNLEVLRLKTKTTVL